LTEIEQFRDSLSFVTLTLDNRKLLLNDNPHYAMRISKELADKKIGYEKTMLIKDLIFEGCETYRIDYLNEQNLERCAREVSKIWYERIGAQKRQMEEKAIREDEAQLLAERAKTDEDTKIKLYLVDEVMQRIPIKTFLDNGEVVYYDFDKKVYRMAGGSFCSCCICVW
jgi:outer membrane protein OmpA-like peptidoglycan-associated protein